MSCSEHEVLAVGVLWFFSFCEAQQVLDEFQDEFIQQMDSNAVVLDLLHHNIINRGELKKIARTEDPIGQNKLLHLYLKENCTKDDFYLVCDIISEVKGIPKLSALGTAMRRRLETGNSVCACVHWWGKVALLVGPTLVVVTSYPAHFHTVIQNFGNDTPFCQECEHSLRTSLYPPFHAGILTQASIWVLTCIRLKLTWLHWAVAFLWLMML